MSIRKQMNCRWVCPRDFVWGNGVQFCDRCEDSFGLEYCRLNKKVYCGSCHWVEHLAKVNRELGLGAECFCSGCEEKRRPAEIREENNKKIFAVPD